MANFIPHKMLDLAKINLLVVSESRLAQLAVNMYEVLHPQLVIEGFPLKIQCTASWYSKLFLGTSDGAILAYEVSDEPSFTIMLSEVSKDFSKKPIDSLVVLPTSKSLLVLSDSLLVMCDYNTLLLPSTLPKTKGCSFIQARQSAIEATAATHDQFAAIVRKSIIIFTATQYEVVQLKEIKLSHIPASLIWSGDDTIVFPIIGGVFYVDTQSGSVSSILTLEQLGVSRTTKPKSPCIMVQAPGDLMFFTLEEICYHFDVHNQTLDRLFEWSAIPSYIVYEDYYLAALICDSVEVRSVKSGQILQSICLPDCLTLLPGQLIFAASTYNVWRLLPLDFEDQIDELVSENRFDDALKFIDELEFSRKEDKISNITKVRALQAHYMFTEEKLFDDALEILETLNASPLDVLDFLPALFEAEVDWNAPNVDLDAVSAISGYLLRERARLAKYCFQIKDTSNTPVQSTEIASAEHFIANGEPFMSDTPTHDDVHHLSVIIDTSLLKAYLALNSPLLRSLVRVDNHCDIATAELLFNHTKKFDALIDLYFAKQLHLKALEWLASNIDSKDSVVPLAQYLKRLSLFEQMPLVFKYTPLVISKNADLGLSIFTEDRNQLSQEDRARVYEFLLDCAPLLAVKYLEHVIFDLSDTTRSFHNALAFAYLKKTELHTVSDDTTFHTKLAEFLCFSTNYDPEAILLRMPSEGLLNIRAIIYGRLKRHQDALFIYVTKLHDYTLACKYCEDQYNVLDSESLHVFTILFELLMKAPNRTFEENIVFLSTYADKLDSTAALKLLKPELTFSMLEEFLSKSQEALIDTKNMNVVKTAMLRSERVQLQQKLLTLQSKRVCITDENMCNVCFKRISNAMLTHFLDGSVAHAYCIR
ncbi:Vacuolar morphogenesis protein 6 [Batrachochytrium dendrobatidis]